MEIMVAVGFDILCEAYLELRDADDRRRALRLSEWEQRDPEQHTHLIRLLSADTSVVDQLLESALRDSECTPQCAGPSLPGLVLLSVIGEGGFGVVYLAEQAKPMQRLVAVKVLRRELLGHASHHRFLDECQAMAIMDHPYVAPVLSWGLSSDGRPYIVMPLIPGAPITDYCRELNLDVHQIVGLMARVAEGVEHAHSRGIIHRDLKPANVIVSGGDGAHVPRVIDFGLAKAVDGPLIPHHQLTVEGHLVGTLQYMSPEHATAGTIDVRSDVYALGLMLWELLTQRPPYSRERAELAVRLGEVRELFSVTLPPPSRYAGRAVPRELDWIVSKATAIKPDDRYPTCAALRADLRAFAEGGAVLAGPPARMYRLWSWARRNAVLATAVAAVLAATAAAVSVSTWMSIREYRARRQATEVVTFLESIIEGLDPALAQGRDRTLVLEALRRAAAAQDLESQPREVQLQICRLLARAYLNVGEPAAALQFADRARAVGTRIFREQDQRWFTAQLLYLEAAKDVLAPGQLERDGILPSRKAFCLRLRQEFPRGSRGRAVATLAAGGYAWLDDTGPDRNAYLRELHEDLKASLGVSDRLTLRVGRWRARNLDPDHEQALAILLDIRTAAAGAYGPEDPDVLAGLDMEGYHLLHARGPEAAIQHIDAGLPAAERVLGGNHKTVVFAYENLGHALLRAGRLGEAENVVRIALQRSESALGREAHLHALNLGYWYTIQLCKGDLAAADIALAELGTAASRWMDVRWTELPEMILASEDFEQIVLALDRVGRSERADRICAAESIRNPDLVRRIVAKRSEQRANQSLPSAPPASTRP